MTVNEIKEMEQKIIEDHEAMVRLLFDVLNVNNCNKFIKTS